MAISARLVDDTGATLLSLDRDVNGTILNEIDLGYPAVRSASTSLSGQDGEFDVTQLLGSRPIVATVTLPQVGIGRVQDTIRGLMHPGRRYWLYVTRDDWATDRMIRVRAATLAMKNGGFPLTAQLGWSAPSPMLQDTVLSKVTLNPTGQPGGGMKFPVSDPMAFTPSLAPGASVLSVAGTVNAPFTVDIYGPCSGPLFRVVDTGCQLDFPTLSLAQGDYLHIDTAARTITLNSDPNQSRYDRLDFASSAWPSLPPGSPQVIFSPDSSSPGCSAVVSWRSSWL